MPRARSQRDAERLTQGDAALLTARRGAELAGALGGTDEERLSLLRAEGLVHTVRGREVVIWGEVLAWVREQDQPDKPTKKPTGTRLPRAYPL